MDFLVQGPKTKPLATFLFAHGAGAPMDSDFMEEVSGGLAAQKIKVVRFEFPYMNTRRTTGKKMPPDRQNKCTDFWNEVLTQFPKGPLFIGGKSMGGRMASLIFEQSRASGLIVFGFPFHAPGKLEFTKAEHLKSYSKPAIILQGERDSMGSKAELKTKKFGTKVKIKYLDDGDHSLKPRKKSGLTFEDNLNTAVGLATEFIKTNL